MTGAQFKKVIQHYGEEHIIAIQFDNYAAKMFSDGEQFKLNINFNEELECLQWPSFDKFGKPFEACIPVSEIKCVMAKNADFKRSDFDAMSLRG